jgi:hypothetical protein
MEPTGEDGKETASAVDKTGPIQAGMSLEGSKTQWLLLRRRRKLTTGMRKRMRRLTGLSTTPRTSFSSSLSYSHFVSPCSFTRTAHPLIYSYWRLDPKV